MKCNDCILRESEITPCDKYCDAMEEYNWLKYQWLKYGYHNLIKNPDDLPLPGSEVIVCMQMDYGKKYYHCEYTNEFKIEWSKRVIAWKYFEKFEENTL